MTNVSREIARLLLYIALAAASMPCAGAQLPTEFDVASIKRNTSDTEAYSTRTPPGGRFTATNVPLEALILQAFDIKDFQLTGAPGWVGSERYDINAEAPTSGKLGAEDLKPLIQSLLASRFNLKYHRVTRELPVYALVVARSGPKLQPNTGAPGPETSRGKNYIEATKVPVATFAGVLEAQLERHLVDDTGLTGDFDFKLKWTPSQAGDTSGPSIFTALVEQYGLRVESRKGPVDVIVIDHIERPSEN